MARVRSPNYPALSLPEAIEAVAKIQSAEQHLAAPKEVAAKHLGYTSYHGLAKRVVAAIENYGLLEETTGDKVKVSPLAMSILFPATPEEKQTAINEAASKHPLFAAINEEWHGSRPSDENLRVYLIRRKFATDALDRVIEIYKQTMDLVTSESGGYIPPAKQPQGAASAAPKGPLKPGATLPIVPQINSQALSEQRPFAVTFMGDAIDIAGRISDEESADRLIEAITALKALLHLRVKPEIKE